MTVLLSFVSLLGKAHQLEWTESFREAASKQAVAKYKLLFLHSRSLNLQEITADILELREKYEVLKKGQYQFNPHTLGDLYSSKDLVSLYTELENVFLRVTCFWAGTISLHNEHPTDIPFPKDPTINGTHIVLLKDISSSLKTLNSLDFYYDLNTRRFLDLTKDLEEFFNILVEHYKNVTGER